MPPMSLSVSFSGIDIVLIVCCSFMLHGFGYVDSIPMSVNQSLSQLATRIAIDLKVLTGHG